MNDALTLFGVVLSGGRSTRMGTDKALLRHSNGETFLQHSVSRLTQVCDGVGVSLAAAAQDALWQGLADESIRTIEDPVADLGPVVGIAAALREAAARGFQGCLVTPVDMPWLTTLDLQRLRDAWRDHPLEIFCAADAQRLRPQPLVAIYPVGEQPALQLLAESQDRSISRWLGTRVPHLVALSDRSLQNINRPEDMSDGKRIRF